MKKITHDFIQNNQKQIDLLEEKAKLIYNKSLSNQTEKLNSSLLNSLILLILIPFCLC